MFIVRAAATLALWGIVLATGSLAYIAAMREFVLDNRVPFAFHVCAAAMILGYLAAAGLAGLARRRGLAAAESWPRLGADRHALILLAASLAALGMSHVDPEFSLKTIREEVPPNLAWIYPAAAFLAPIWIRRSAARVDAADQALLLILGATLLSGALFFVPPHLALGLGIVAVLMRLRAGARRLSLSPIFLAALLTVLLLLAATIHARNRYLAEPSMAWIGSAASIALAISLAPRDRGAWLRLLAVPVLIASVIALCDVLLTLKLGFLITFPSALDSRLVLFRQHPNFLAPFFVFHAVLAVGLGLSRARWSLLAWPALALLAYACWHTDSNTGKAALLLGLAALPALYLLRFAWRALGGGRVAALLALFAILCAAGGWFAFWSDVGERWLSGKIDRFEKSIDYRADAWVNSLKVIHQSPWLGIGPHNFIAVERFKPGSRFASEAEAPHPHNMLLYVAQSAGVCALLAAGALIVLLLLRLLLEAVRPRAGIPAALPVALVASGLALLAANQFDLGLALDTVVPFPFFLITGLALALGAAERRALQPGQTLALAALVLLPAWSFVSEPLRAMILVRQAQILSFEHKFNADPEGSLEGAKDMLREAIRRSPVVEEAHDVLARLQGSDPEAQAVIESLIAV
ncbi:MAG: O-antigen ligase family protein, partial [Planctomycetes bacterium]|nr:O-antigen ligase family protein [Planctomycetota bacterium]